MSLDILGHDIDIHTGGIDLRFPHHEDERAQSNSITGREVVRHWVHAEHLLFEGRKMSKSSGNVVLVSDVIQRGLDPLSLRLAFLQHRYRQQMNLTWEVIEGAETTLTRWRGRIAQWANSPSAPLDTNAVDAINAAFNEDLDTPLALQQLRAVDRDAKLSDGTKFETFAHVDRLFGLDLTRDIGRSPVAHSPEVQGLLAERAIARRNEDWAGSDRLRDQLAELGVEVIDTAGGQQTN